MAEGKLMFCLMNYAAALLKREGAMVTLRSQVQMQREMLFQMERTLRMLEQAHAEVERCVTGSAKKEANGN